MLTHILFVNRQLAFAVSIKQALERTGNFEVHPFTSLESALEYLSSRPQDVAVVDFTLPNADPAAVVQALRDIQPGLAIIAMPRQPEAVITALSLQGSVNSTVTARELIPVVNRAIEGRRTGRLEGAAPSERSGLLTRVLEDAPSSAPPQTRRAKSRPPDDLPEYTSLENVLSSRGASEDDTPSRPVAEAPVEHPEGEESFEAILSKLDPELDEESAASIFDDLVNSMRSSDPHRPLPARHQQFVEFILTGGMDSLLDEINRSKTDELPSVEGISSSADDEVEAERLSSAPSVIPSIDEEPPPPSFEDSGTVGDLYTGVNDASFRSVLSILRGEEPVEEPAEPAAASNAELREAFASFYESQAEQAGEAIHFPTEDEIEAVLASVEAESIQRAPPRLDFDEEPSDSAARIILETALDESTPPESFSISELIASIERQLPAHRPKVQPLPSWLRESQAKKDELDRFVREPDFLPEALSELGAAPTVASARVEDDVEALLRATEAQAQRAEPLPAFDFGDEAFDQTTRPSGSADILAEPEALETEWLPYAEAADLDAVFEPYDAPPEALPEGWGEVTGRPGVPGTAELTETAAVREPALDPMATEVGPALPVEAGPEESPVLEGDSISYTKPYAIGELQASILSAVDPEALVYVDDDAHPPARDAQAPYLEPVMMPDGAPAVEDADIFSLRHIEDPYIAQLALSLTELSLETTAEAALLSRDNAIVAFAGRMLREDVEALQIAIDGKWDANVDEARIRFLTLEGSGKDYMLYSRRTVDDLSLSLIFSGQTPLRDIRRQGKRLIEALRAVPEVAVPEPEPERAIPALEPVPIDETLTRTSFAYLWLTRDPSTPLSSSLAQAIANVLHNQLAREAWRVHEIQAHDEYVYLLSDVPGDAPPYKVVRELKRRAAEIACQYNPTLNPDTLWADSYLVVMPGRSLDPDEIQQFINFERML